MKVKDFPEWVLKFKQPGFTIRKNGDNFALYKVSSHRVPGLKYPRIEQEFIGVLDQEKGLIQKNQESIHLNI